MKETDEARVAALLEGSTERRNLEFKSPFSWSDLDRLWLRERTIRAILAMSNTPNGGNIVIGVDENERKQPRLTGMSAAEIASFENGEAIKGTVDSFASLGTEFEVSIGLFQARTFVIITVSEFDRRPVICARDGELTGKAGDEKRVLRKGDIYTRSRRGEPRSDRITDNELDELLDLWASKRPPTARPPVASTDDRSEDLYNDALKELL